MYSWMLYNSSPHRKRANIDRILPSALLAHILAARGILARSTDSPCLNQTVSQFMSRRRCTRRQLPLLGLDHDMHIVNMYDSYIDVRSMFSTDWTIITDGFEEN